jgi:Flp pilus assembly protein TadG
VTVHCRLRLRSLIGDRGGVAAVEFGLVLSFFAMFVLGIMEVARYVTDQQDLYSAVHSAGRYAIVHGSASSSPATSSTLQTQVGNDLSILPSSAVSTTVNFSPNNNPGSTVTITSTYTWTPLVPLVPLPTATITATSAATILN